MNEEQEIVFEKTYEAAGTALAKLVLLTEADDDLAEFIEVLADEILAVELPKLALVTTKGPIHPAAEVPSLVALYNSIERPTNDNSSTAILLGSAIDAGITDALEGSNYACRGILLDILSAYAKILAALKSVAVSDETAAKVLAAVEAEDDNAESDTEA